MAVSINHRDDDFAEIPEGLVDVIPDYYQALLPVGAASLSDFLL